MSLQVSRQRQYCNYSVTGTEKSSYPSDHFQKKNLPVYVLCFLGISAFAVRSCTWKPRPMLFVSHVTQPQLRHLPCSFLSSLSPVVSSLEVPQVLLTFPQASIKIFSAVFCNSMPCHGHGTLCTSFPLQWLERGMGFEASLLPNCLKLTLLGERGGGGRWMPNSLFWW